MGLNCYRIRDLFSGLIDDRLSAKEKTRVLDHLASCTECAGDYELFRKTRELVAGLEPIAVSPDFTAKVLARVREQRAADSDLAWIPSVRGAALARPRVLVWAGRIAAAAAVAALTLGLWRLATHPRTNSAPVPYAQKAASPSTATPSVAARQERATQAGGEALAARGSGLAPVSSSLSLAHKVFTDSLYDQPSIYEEFPLDPRYIPEGQKASARPDTGGWIVPVNAKGREFNFFH